LTKVFSIFSADATAAASIVNAGLFPGFMPVSPQGHGHTVSGLIVPWTYKRPVPQKMFHGVGASGTMIAEKDRGTSNPAARRRHPSYKGNVQ
jgi:hypothetical protein